MGDARRAGLGLERSADEIDGGVGMARIYLASSWRNERQPAMVGLLRGWVHEVYDFRNPPHGEGGFAWRRLEADLQGCDARVFRDQLLSHPSAAAGYLSAYRARMRVECGNVASAV